MALATGSKAGDKKRKDWRRAGFCSTLKSKSSEKYKYVIVIDYKGKVYYNVHISSMRFRKNGFVSEKEAALCVDKFLIQNGKHPVNLLVKK